MLSAVLNLALCMTVVNKYNCVWYVNQCKCCLRINAPQYISMNWICTNSQTKGQRSSALSTISSDPLELILPQIIGVFNPLIFSCPPQKLPKSVAVNRLKDDSVGVITQKTTEKQKPRIFVPVFLCHSVISVWVAACWQVHDRSR